MASLEDWTDSVAATSGMAALDVTTTVLASAGCNIVSTSSVYGGAHSYLTTTALIGADGDDKSNTKNVGSAYVFEASDGS